MLKIDDGSQDNGKISYSEATVQEIAERWKTISGNAVRQALMMYSDKPVMHKKLRMAAKLTKILKLYDEIQEIVNED